MMSRGNKGYKEIGYIRRPYSPIPYTLYPIPYTLYLIPYTLYLIPPPTY